jgi:hypothetical protein
VSAKLFIAGVVALVFVAGACFAWKREYAKSLMFVGAAVANGAAAFIR